MAVQLRHNADTLILQGAIPVTALTAGRSGVLGGAIFHARDRDRFEPPCGAIIDAGHAGGFETDRL